MSKAGWISYLQWWMRTRQSFDPMPTEGIVSLHGDNGKTLKIIMSDEDNTGGFGMNFNDVFGGRKEKVCVHGDIPVTEFCEWLSENFGQTFSGAPRELCFHLDGKEIALTNLIDSECGCCGNSVTLNFEFLPESEENPDD